MEDIKHVALGFVLSDYTKFCNPFMLSDGTQKQMKVSLPYVRLYN